MQSSDEDKIIKYHQIKCLLCSLVTSFSEKDPYRLALQSILVIEHLFSFYFVQLLATVVVSWGFATPTSYTQIHHKKTNIKKKTYYTKLSAALSCGCECL